MTLIALVIVATLSGLAAGAIAWRWAGRAGAPRTEAAAARSRWARRLDPQAATGLALTLAFAVIVLGGLVAAVLAYLVRGNTEVVRIDSGVAEWGDRNASGFATDVLTAISHVGEPKVVIALAALVAIAETIRTRSRWVIPFMALVVAGNGRDHDDGQGARRPRPADAQPDRGDARAVVPERPFVLVGGVLRRHGAPGHPRAQPARADAHRRRMCCRGGEHRRDARAARRALAQRRDRRTRPGLGVVLRLRDRLRRAAAAVRRPSRGGRAQARLLGRGRRRRRVSPPPIRLRS